MKRKNSSGGRKKRAELKAAAEKHWGWASCKRLKPHLSETRVTIYNSKRNI